MKKAQAMLLALAVAASAARAQNSAVVDEATFMIARSGKPIGRESFRIIRAPGPGGQVYRAVATSSVDSLRYSSTLATDSTGAPVSYELRVTQRGDPVAFVIGRGRPDRFSVLVQNKGGESAAEYLLRRGTILLDEDLFNQFYFVALASAAAPDAGLSVISPRGGPAVGYKFEFKSIDAVQIGGQSLTGRHYILYTDAGTRAEVWLDAAGRLLKASVPDRSLVALRDDPPR